MRLHSPASRRIVELFCAVGIIGLAVNASAQVVINEIVKEERVSPQTTAVSPDVREFIELYNAGTTPVNLTDYVLRTTNLSTMFPIDDMLPAGATIAPGGYYVIAVEGRQVANANHYITLGATEELFTDAVGLAIELRDNQNNLVDAIALDVAIGAATLGNLMTNLPDVYAITGRGSWGRVHSYNITETDDFKRLSYGRYQDGFGANSSGHHFGFLPATPGASNNLPINAAHSIPNVDALAPGTPVVGYNYDLIPARVIEPGTAALPHNPSAIPASPQGGRAITFWDEFGGGGSVYSNEIVRSFDLYAYLDSTPLNIPGDWEAEWTAYGIGTTDQWFNTPNPFNSIPGTGATTTLTSNGSTGVGWFYERFQAADGSNTYKLALIDFGAAGNSVQAAGLWDIKATFDLTPGDAGWHRLSIDYDPESGEVVAKFNDETISFTTTTDLLGTFYAGYREGLTGVPATQAANNMSRVRPATWDMISSSTPTENADFNDDGVVDGADFLVWQRGFGGPGGLPQGDADGNGQINAADLTIWKAQFGSAASAAAATAIPEPTSLWLLVAGGSVLARRRRPSLVNAL
jgi:hypothetical protein